MLAGPGRHTEKQSIAQNQLAYQHGLVTQGYRIRSGIDPGEVVGPAGALSCTVDGEVFSRGLQDSEGTFAQDGAVFGAVAHHESRRRRGA